MFTLGIFTRRRKQTGAGAPDAPASLDSGGFDGLEGDFESERRRAAAATHDRSRPYEHGEEDGPVVPGSTSGWTHP